MPTTSKVNKSAKIYETQITPKAVGTDALTPPILANADVDASIKITETPEASATSANHPLAHLVGIMDDEPLWDDFLAAIQDYRREQNELEDIVE